jgi:hypothetical protein
MFWHSWHFAKSHFQPFLAEDSLRRSAHSLALALLPFIPMTRFRTTPHNLRWLLLGALGVPMWACAGQTGPGNDGDGSGGNCTDGCNSTDDGVGGGSTGGRTGTGGGSTGGSSHSGGAATTGGAGPVSEEGCTDQVPLMPGVDTGIFVCAEGYLHRAEAIACPTVLPRDNQVDWPDETAVGGAGNYTTSTDDCSTDADCDALSSCYLTQTNLYTVGCMGEQPPDDIVPDYARLCTIPGCLTDADCDADQVCICGDLVGQCHSISAIAGCKTDADCGAGFLCLENSSTGYFSNGMFACQLPGDECNSPADCGGVNENCSIAADGSGRTCTPAPVCGRPFLIEEEARKAAPITSAAWLTPSAEVRIADLEIPTDAALRSELAAHWTEIGLLEHASVAAFARFTLQLLSLGASAELVEQSQRAALDEVRHAELAFALASRYAGHSIGPGPLPLTGALDASSVEAILRTTVREGCIGETRAALEASRGAETCEDPVVRSVLETIAADEARHAELAWKVVRFIVTAHPEMASVLAEEFGFLDRQERASASVAQAPAESSRFGVLTPSALQRCHREAYRDVIAPCAHTLLAMSASKGLRA